MVAQLVILDREIGLGGTEYRVPGPVNIGLEKPDDQDLGLGDWNELLGPHDDLVRAVAADTSVDDRDAAHLLEHSRPAFRIGDLPALSEGIADREHRAGAHHGLLEIAADAVIDRLKTIDVGPGFHGPANDRIEDRALAKTIGR